MKKLFLIKIIIFLFCVNGFAGTSKSAEVNWDKIAQNFQKRFELVLKNFDKIWHESYPNLEVQFSNGDRAWKITKKQTSEFSVDEKPEFSKTVLGFADVSRNNQPILQIVLTEEALEDISFNPILLFNSNEMKERIAVDVISSYVFHEAFHFYIQEKSHLKNEEMKTSKTAGNSRNTLYPIVAMPRIYRNNIYQTLVLAFENKSKRKTYLRDAKFWFEKYQKEYPIEASKIIETDIAEGTAQYAEEITDIYVNIGFNPKENQLRENILKIIKNKNPLLSVSSESYSLGVVSGFLMDEMKIEWKKKVLDRTKSSTPLDILLKRFKPSDKEPTHKFKHKVELEKFADESNESLELPMKLLMSVYKKEKSYKLLILPSSKGSYRTSGHYTNTSIPSNHTLLLNFSQNINLQNGSIEIDEATVIDLEDFSNSCDYKSSYIIPLDQDNESSVEINTPYKEVQNLDGQTLICLEPDNE